MAERDGTVKLAGKRAGFNGHDVMVLKGRPVIDLPEGRAVTRQPGARFVVPRGMQHRPRAEVGTRLLLIEPAGAPNAGDPATAARKERP